MQELQRNHQRVVARDRAFSASSAADSPRYSSLPSSHKDGASPASSPRAQSGLASHALSGDRKDRSALRYSPGLSGQQKLQGSPSRTPRPNLTSSASPVSHAVAKSKCSDVKHKKASQPLSSKQTSNSQPRLSKSLKEPEHKKCRKPVKKERKGEDKKRRKKKEEKRLSEKRKKGEKIVKRERKPGFKGELSEKSHLTTLSSTKETRMCKSTSLSPKNQGQLPPKNKHRVRSEQAVRTHKPSTNVSRSKASTQPSTLCRSKKRKIPKKKVSKAPFEEQVMHSLASEKKPSIVSSQADNRRKAKPADTLPSLLLKALAPLTTGCSVSLEQPHHGKEGVHGEVLNAPDLQPVAVMGHLQEMGDNLANTPPVLSWQGSPVSAFGEDEEDLEKGVISRPVLQPSPTQCFSPPVEGDSFDGLNNDPCEDALDRYSHISDSPCVTEQISDEEKDQEESHRELSGSLLTEISHHNTSLDDVLKSLTTFVEGQRVSSRGGPFGSAAAGSTRRVKHSSSLAVGPEISCYDLPDLCPKPDSAISASSDNQPTVHATSESPLKSHNAADLRDSVREVTVHEDLNESDSFKESKEDEYLESLTGRTPISVLDGAVRTDRRLTSVHQNSHVCVSIKDERNTACRSRERKRKQVMDEFREGDFAMEIKAEESSAFIPEKNSEVSSLEERDIPNSPQDISAKSPILLNDRLKVHFPQENPTPHGKDMIQDEDTESANNTADLRGLKQLKSSTNGNAVSPRSSSTLRVNAPELFMSTAATQAPCLTADPLRMKALSMGLSKELKILLNKLEIGGRRTVNVAEVEEQKIPLSKISIENTASELVRACK